MPVYAALRHKAPNSCKKVHPAIQPAIYSIKPNEIAVAVDYKWLNNGRIAYGFQPSKPGQLNPFFFQSVEMHRWWQMPLPPSVIRVAV